MTPKVRVAVIGLGAMGRNHLRILSSMPEIEIAALCDKDECLLVVLYYIDARKLPRARRKRGSPRFVKYEDLGTGSCRRGANKQTEGDCQTAVRMAACGHFKTRKTLIAYFISLHYTLLFVELTCANVYTIFCYFIM